MSYNPVKLPYTVAHRRHLSTMVEPTAAESAQLEQLVAVDNARRDYDAFGWRDDRDFYPRLVEAASRRARKAVR